MIGRWWHSPIWQVARTRLTTSATNARRCGRRATRLASMLGAWSNVGHGTLARRLAHGLRIAIDAGVLADGARLPPERGLADLALGQPVDARHRVRRVAGRRLHRVATGKRVEGPRPRSLRSPAAACPTTSATGPASTWPSAIPPTGRTCPTSASTPAISPPTGADPASPHSGCRRCGSPWPIGSPDGGCSPIPSRSTSPPVRIRPSRSRWRPSPVAAASWPSRTRATPASSMCSRPSARRASRWRPTTRGSVPTRWSASWSSAPPSAVRAERPAQPDRSAGLAGPDRRARRGARSSRHRRARGPRVGRPRLRRPSDAAVRARVATRRVLSAGSISKVGWSGLRIGWLRAPAPLVETTKHLHLATDLGTSVPSRAARAAAPPPLRRAGPTAGRVAACLDRARHRVVGTGDPRVADHPARRRRGRVGHHATRRFGTTGPAGEPTRRPRRAPGSVATRGRLPGPNLRICIDRPHDLLEEGLRRLALAWARARDHPPHRRLIETGSPAHLGGAA